MQKRRSESLQAQGLVEFRAYRNMLGSPQVRLVTVWQTLEIWARFGESRLASFGG